MSNPRPRIVQFESCNDPEYDDNRGWIVGDSPARLYFTLDGGATWNADPDMSGLLLRDLDFVDADHGWAIGPNFILKYILAGATDTVAEEVPIQTTLKSNYPNPFNPETTISYSLSRSGRVRLAIYNLLGELVCNEASFVLVLCALTADGSADANRPIKPDFQAK